MKTELELWSEQMRESALAIDELKRVKALDPSRAEEAQGWIDRYHKQYLRDAIYYIMKLTDLTMEDLKKAEETEPMILSLEQNDI